MRSAVLAWCLAMVASSASAAAPKGRLIAVLELRNRVAGRAAETMDAAYFTDRVRQSVLATLPEDRLISRENLLTILAASGKKIEDCEGECEVETGRRVGADLVISGEIGSLGSSLTISLRLHDTRTGQLLGAGSGSAHSPEELDAALHGVVEEALRKVRPPAVFAAPVVLAPLPLPKALQSGAIELDIDADVLVAYDAALEADRSGENEPEQAATAWQRLADFKEQNPYRSAAAIRAREWSEYATKHKARRATYQQDLDKLKKLLPLRSLSKEQKLVLVRKFEAAYGTRAVTDVILALPERDLFCADFGGAVSYHNRIQADVYAWEADIDAGSMTWCKERRIVEISWRAIPIATSLRKGDPVCEPRGYRRASAQEASQFVTLFTAKSGFGEFHTWAWHRAPTVFVPPPGPAVDAAPGAVLDARGGPSSSMGTWPDSRTIAMCVAETRVVTAQPASLR